MEQNVIAFVQGVDKCGAPPPEGFPCRFAVLTWFEVEGAAVDPWPLLRLAIPRVATLVGAETVRVEFWERIRCGFLRLKVKERKIRELPWEHLMELGDQALLESDFPDRFIFLQSGREVLHAKSEMWSLCGGPSPYHDSVTISFFSREPLDEALQAIFTEEAGRLGVTIQPSQEQIQR